MKKLIFLMLIVSLFCFELVYAKKIDSIFNNFYGIDKDYKNVEFPTEKIGMANPASVYCHELGYEYKIVETDKGQKGICVFPDKSECEEWQFLTGKCRQEYSYCARQGYDLIIKTDGKNPFSRHYTVCVQKVFPKLEVGSVTDLMDLRGKAIRGSIPLQSEQEVSMTDLEPLGGSTPSSFDWRNKDGKDWMTPVKNQGDCGSCWAFSAVGVTEAMHNIHKNNANIDLDLSEEYLVSDCLSWDNCCGGSKYWALDFIIYNGIVDETCFPYEDASDCTCFPGITCNTDCDYHDGNVSGGNCSNTICSAPYRCADWATELIYPINYIGDATILRHKIKQHLIDKGPLAVSMNTRNGSWRGDIYECDPDSPTGHAVIITGYNDGGSYWIVKNSWGVGWNGEPDPKDGYFFVGYGECSIESYAYYAINDTVPPTPVTNLYSMTHYTDECTWDNSVRVTWTPATDAGRNSGLDGYSIKWSESASDLPDTIKDIEENVASRRDSLDDGCWYFHIRSVDNLGNWNPNDVSTGPFCIDTSPPYAPTNLQSINPLNVWTTDNTIDVSWTAAEDNDTISSCNAGVINYSYEWSLWFPIRPDKTVDISADVTSITSSALDDGEWFFSIRSLDGVGNWGNYTSIGPFLIDTEEPYHIFRNKQDQWYTETTPYFDIDFFDEIALDDSSYQYDSQGSWFDIDTDNPGTYYMDNWLASDWVYVGDGAHYLYFKIKDDAGNVYWTPNDTEGFKFNKDTTGPDVDVEGAPADWQNFGTTAWVNCSDEGWGCDGSTYRLRYYDSNPTICPDTYSSYNRGSPRDITSHKWICGVAKDILGTAGFSSPVEFKIDRINPVADAGSDKSVMKGQSVTFTGSATDQGGSGIDPSSYYWDFGDRTPGKTGQSVSHTYNIWGIFTAELTVEDRAGNSDDDTLTVTVRTKPIAVIDSITPKPVIQGETVYFTGHGTDEDGYITAYHWRSNLDDQLSTSASFNTNQLSAGYHTIYFGVQDNDGIGSDWAITHIRVWPPPDWKMFHKEEQHLGSTGPVINTSGPQIYGSKWTHLTGGAVDSSPVMANFDNNWVNGLETVIASNNGNVYILNNAGPLPPLCTYPVGSAITSTPAVADINFDGNLDIVFGATDGKVYAIDNNCNQIWNFSTGGPVDSSPVIADIAPYSWGYEVAVGSDDWNVYLLKASSGTKIWSFKTNDPVDSSPAVADIKTDLYGLEVVVGSDDNNVYCIGTMPKFNTPVSVWNFTTGGSVDSSPAIADIDDVTPGLETVVGSDDGNVYLIDSLGSPIPIWTFLTGGPVDSSPAVDSIYEDPWINIAVGSDDDKVYVLNKFGAMVGSFDTGGDVDSSPAIAEINRNLPLPEVVVGSWNGTVWALNFFMGGPNPTVAWWFFAGFPIMSMKSSPGVAETDHDGMLEIGIGSNNGNFYMLDGLPLPFDRDSDGFADASDNCPYVWNPGQENADGDSWGDVCDDCPTVWTLVQNDTDGDSYGNACDNCWQVPNPGQEDTDLDFRGDVCDNCPNDPNGAQTDADNDGFGEACDCNDTDDTVYPNATELCDNKDNDCDGTIDDFTRSCGSGNCIGTQTCIAGVWGDCSSPGQDCGICCTCNSSAQENYNETQDEDCGLCQECGDVFLCTNQTNGNDLKDECPEDNCKYGYCDGSGACVMKPNDTDCGLCKLCDGYGSCTDWPADDSDCGTIDCDGLDITCRDYHDLTSNRCQGFGNCKEPNSMECTDYTDAPSTTDCGICALCDGAGSCNAYDETQDIDCPNITCPDACDIDANPYTWDYADDALNECIGLFTCSDNTCDYSHECHDDNTTDGIDGNTCGAECDQDEDCDDLDPETIDVCLNNCTCEHRPFIPPCGNGVIDPWEECDPAATPTGCSGDLVCDSLLCVCYLKCIDADDDGWDMCDEFGDPIPDCDDPCDCDDDPVACGASCYPGATEVCDDTYDNDCDGLIDGDDPECVTTTSTTTTVPCICGPWINTRTCCEGWSYPANKYIRNCNPSGCDKEWKCVRTRFCRR